MKLIVGLLLITSNSFCYAQSQQEEIDEQVWKPFIAAFNGLDAEAFMAVHSRDVVRAIRDDGKILGFEEYLKSMVTWNASSRDQKLKKTLELRFVERSASNGFACEVGIYRSQTQRPTGEISTGYGKFLVILRKENNVWKILVDSDSSEGGTIGGKDFLNAKPITPR